MHGQVYEKCHGHAHIGSELSVVFLICNTLSILSIHGAVKDSAAIHSVMHI